MHTKVVAALYKHYRAKCGKNRRNKEKTRTALPEAIHDAKRHKTNSAPLYIHV